MLVFVVIEFYVIVMLFLFIFYNYIVKVEVLFLFYIEEKSGFERWKFYVMLVSGRVGIFLV